MKLADSRRGNSLEGSDGIQADQDSSSPDNGGWFCFSSKSRLSVQSANLGKIDMN